MQFNIEADRGDYIQGYLVPDAFTAQATIRVTTDHRVLAILKAQDVRHAVVAAGRHESGLVGFVVTEALAPGLSQASSLEISDAETGFIIYRRRPPACALPLRLFRLETEFGRLSRLDNSLDHLFQTSFVGVDTFGRETTAQTLLLETYSSLYISARIMFKEHEYALDDTFKKIVILQDPYVELAKTILSLGAAQSARPEQLDLRMQLSMLDGVEYFSTSSMTSERDIRSLLMKLPDSVEAVISNPLARLLAARPSEETANASYLAASLQSLASFDIVGIREDPKTFVEPLADLLQIDKSPLDIDEVSTEAQSLADQLRAQTLARTILDLDLEIYELVKGAIRNPITPSVALS